MRDKTQNGIHAKLLDSCIRSWALGKSLDVNLRLNFAQASALSEALAATDALREACVKETSLEKIVEAIENKKVSARVFEEAFAFPWPI